MYKEEHILSLLDKIYTIEENLKKNQFGKVLLSLSELFLKAKVLTDSVSPEVKWEPISEDHVSTGLFSCLRAEGIRYVHELAEKSEKDLKLVPNLGKTEN